MHSIFNFSLKIYYLNCLKSAPGHSLTFPLKNVFESFKKLKCEII